MYLTCFKYHALIMCLLTQLCYASHSIKDENQNDERNIKLVISNSYYEYPTYLRIQYTFKLEIKPLIFKIEPAYSDIFSISNHTLTHYNFNNQNDTILFALYKSEQDAQDPEKTALQFREVQLKRRLESISIKISEPKSGEDYVFNVYTEYHRLPTVPQFTE